MNREFCCTNCGMIWFDTNMNASQVTCPECGKKNSQLLFCIYPCDSMGWFYASENAVKELHKRGKKIHYHKDHPWHGKEG